MSNSSDIDRQIEQLRRCEIIKVPSCFHYFHPHSDGFFEGIGSKSAMCDG